MYDTDGSPDIFRCGICCLLWFVDFSVSVVLYLYVVPIKADHVVMPELSHMSCVLYVKAFVFGFSCLPMVIL